MNLRFSLPILFIILIFAACKKKDYPESQVLNAPAFYADLQFESSTLSLEAGKNNYRLYSSYNQDSAGLYRYVSELKNESCTANCPNSLRVEFMDSQLKPPGASSDINLLIKPGTFDYASRSWRVSFESSFNKPAASYSWDFGDGTVSNQKDPVHVYKESGRYQVCLKIVSAGACESSICNSIDVGFPPDHCSASISATNNGSNTVAFSALITGQAPFTYYWDFGDGKSSTLAQPVHQYLIPGAYAVQLTVKDSKGNISVNRHYVATLSDQSSCITNFRTKDMLAGQNPYAFSTVKLSYVDANGQSFESSAFEQDANSRFEIVSVEDFQENERGEATKKLKVRFNARLYQGANSLLLKPSEAVLCISYKP